ncbi:eukaryotic translation initiation factor 4 gamma-like [Copidosoma floridanum]|uniref:eukaryotic translation initiation factor 4 gamma-like n=1 Tax=Copidosoma floridanum TaxID=29053 RepID=UPI0006C96B40|nr:eukaryotic translation initiation factor 4 gamma-like [Copidosoma floridanum]
MEEEEDWDTPSTPAAKPPAVTPTVTTSTTTAPQQSSSSNTSTDNTLQTLKITDGYKYSYEALASPANVEDWVDPPTYESSKRILNGFTQSNSFRDNNKPYRSDRSDNYKRFDKRNTSYSNPSGDFVAPKPRYSRPVPNVNPNDWDAPVNNTPPPPINGSWNDNVHVPITNPVEDDWDAPGGGTPKSITNRKSTPVPIFNPPVTAKPIASKDVEEDWDAPSGSSSKADVLPPVELPTFRPSSAASVSVHSVHNDAPTTTPSQLVDEENWDEPGTPHSVSQVVMPTFKPPTTSFSEKNDEEDWDAEPSQAKTGNGYPKNIPSFSSRNSDGAYSNSQRYDDNWKSNKYQRSRNFDSNNDHFSRSDPFSRHSGRGNYRNNSYDRGSRGSRGNRGGRGRGGRDFNSSFGSRDNSRSRGDRDDKPYRSNDRPYQPPASFQQTVVHDEEDWDSPTGFASKSAEKSGPPPLPTIAPIIQSQPVMEEESWD